MSWIDDFFELRTSLEHARQLVCDRCFMEKPVSGVHDCDEDR